MCRTQTHLPFEVSVLHRSNVILGIVILLQTEKLISIFASNLVLVDIHMFIFNFMVLTLGLFMHY
jgi:hypothetical protein